MMDPERLLHEARTSKGTEPAHHALKVALLRVAKADAPPPAEARQRVLAALGLGDGVVSAAGSPVSGIRRARASEWRDEAPLFASVFSRGGGSLRSFGAPLAIATLAHAALFVLLVRGGSPDPTVSAEARELTLKVRARPHGASMFTPAPRAELESPRDPSRELKPEIATALRDDKRELRREEGAAPLRKAADRAAPEQEGAPIPAPPAPAAPPSTLLPSGPPPSEEVLPFGEGMSWPHWVEGPKPEYTREAREAKVSGTMLVKCVITTQGALRGCQVLKSLPFMDQPVLAALARQRYTPVTFQGRTINVEYVIPLKFELP